MTKSKFEIPEIGSPVARAPRIPKMANNTETVILVQLAARFPPIADSIVRDLIQKTKQPPKSDSQYLIDCNELEFVEALKKIRYQKHLTEDIYQTRLKKWHPRLHDIKPDSISWKDFWTKIQNIISEIRPFREAYVIDDLILPVLRKDGIIQ